MSRPFLPRSPGDRLRAADWQQLQQELGDRLEQPQHRSPPLSAAVFAPTSRLQARRLRARRIRLADGTPAGLPLEDHLDAAVLDRAWASEAIAEKLPVTGGVIDGSLTVKGRLEVGGNLRVDGDLRLPERGGGMGAGAARYVWSAGAMSLSEEGVAVFQAPVTVAELTLVFVQLSFVEGAAPGPVSVQVGTTQYFRIHVDGENHGELIPHDDPIYQRLYYQYQTRTYAEMVAAVQQGGAVTAEEANRQVAAALPTYGYSQPIYETYYPNPAPAGLATTLSLELRVEQNMGAAPAAEVAAWNQQLHKALLWERDGNPLPGGRSLQHHLLLTPGTWTLQVIGKGSRRPLQSASLALSTLPIGAAP